MHERASAQYDGFGGQAHVDCLPCTAVIPPQRQHLKLASPARKLAAARCGGINRMLARCNSAIRALRVAPPAMLLHTKLHQQRAPFSLWRGSETLRLAPAPLTSDPSW